MLGSKIVSDPRMVDPPELAPIILRARRYTEITIFFLGIGTGIMLTVAMVRLAPLLR
jgi:hypothetical protein